MRRAIDIFEGGKIDEKALKALIRAAVEYNQNKSKKKAVAAYARESRQKREGVKLSLSSLAPVPGARRREAIRAVVVTRSLADLNVAQSPTT